jgi:hypothetical protein
MKTIQNYPDYRRALTTRRAKPTTEIQRIRGEEGKFFRGDPETPNAHYSMKNGIK